MSSIMWPDLKFGPVNLLSLPPAWFFYLSSEEKMALAQSIKHSDDEKLQSRLVH